MRVLLVEDDKRLAAFILKGLKEAGLAADHVTDGSDGLSWLTRHPFDAAVVDIMLPGMDGLSMVAELRRRKVLTPVIFLSAKGTTEDRVRGLQTGGDDYLAKPFSFTELLARIQALIRRASATAEPTTLVCGDLVMDLLARTVRRHEREIELQPREFSLLEYLMRNAGRVVSKTMIMEHVWSYNFDPLTNVVEVRISHLRDKIDRPFSTRLIHTVRGAGYVLRPDA